MRTLWSNVSSALIGAMAAVATVVAWNSVNSADASQPHLREDVAARSTNNESSIIVRQVGESRLSELERQLQELRAERTADATRSVAEDRTHILSPEEERLQFQERLSGLDRLQDDDIADPTWAPKAERSLFAGLTEMAEGLEFSVETAECKTTTCRASISWPDYKTALKTGSELAERAFPGLGCLQIVSYPPPDDQGAPYSTKLYLDCTKARAESVGSE